MRAAIGRRMVESKTRAPHFYVESEVPMEAVLAAVDAAPPDAPRTSVTAYLARACVVALQRHPRLNARWRGDVLEPAESVNLGVAVALEDGLIAPALLGAEQLSLAGTGDALRDLVARARATRLKPPELAEGTFTLSNLGMFDVARFTAIIVPPQVAILATGATQPRLALDGSSVVGVRTLAATVSADHRAVDGADVAAFLQTFKELLQNPKALDG
jgi:pyruvate dehydrogenase E2 component (dihydrolipoamide acetyltransferase)